MKNRRHSLIGDRDSAFVNVMFGIGLTIIWIMIVSVVGKPIYNKIQSSNVFNKLKQNGIFDGQSSMCRIGIAEYNKGQYDKAITYFNSEIRYSPNNTQALLYKGKCLNKLGEYNQAISILEKCEKLNPKNAEAHKENGLSYYELEKYEKSIDEYKKVNGLNPKDAEAYAWQGLDYLALEKPDEASKLCEKAISMDPKCGMGYSVKGMILYASGSTVDGDNLMDEAIKIDSKNVQVYINKVETLFDDEKYLQSEAICWTAEPKFPYEPSFYYYDAQCHSMLGQYYQAIDCFNKVLKIEPDNDDVIEYIGEEYYYLENYDKAEQQADKALKINPSNQYATELKEQIKTAKLPEGEKVVNFVKENYLYIDKVPDFDEKAKAFEQKSNITSEDVKSFIDSIKYKGDMYTYVITSSDYDKYQDVMNTPDIDKVQVNSNTWYISIGSFSTNVGAEFNKIVNGIKNPESQNLIIDLRDNGGGSLKAANQMLDTLLPKCTTSFTITRDGTINQYHSDEKQIKFRKIVILVNENSASASEMFSLSLKKYLNNVTIIGHPTRGKGVGQQVIDDYKLKYTIALISFYWNVKEENIAGDKVHPDIVLSGSSDEDYKNAALNVLNNN